MKEIKIVAEIALKGIALFILCLPLIASEILYAIGDTMSQVSEKAVDSICEATSSLWLDIEELKEML